MLLSAESKFAIEFRRKCETTLKNIFVVYQGLGAVAADNEISASYFFGPPVLIG
jgi:hypothetical protein